MSATQAAYQVLIDLFQEVLEDFRGGRPILICDQREGRLRTYIAVPEERVSAPTLRAMAHAAMGLLCLLTTCKEMSAVQLAPSLQGEFTLGTCFGKARSQQSNGSSWEPGEIPVVPITEKLEIAPQQAKPTQWALALSVLAGIPPSVFFCEVAPKDSTLDWLNVVEGFSCSPLRIVNVEEIRGWFTARRIDLLGRGHRA